MRMMKYLSILLLIYTGCRSIHITGTSSTDLSCENLNLKSKSECEILHILSDTLMWRNRKLNAQCVDDVVFDIFKQTSMMPYRHCDFGGCGYYSYSLTKSIFLVDLFRLFKFYNCSDYTILKNNIRGSFSEIELETIKQSRYGKNPIDTSILSK